MPKFSMDIDPDSFLPLLWGGLLSVSFFVIRFAFTSEDYYDFLPYNLFLAFIPLILSWLIVRYSRHPRLSRVLLVAAGFVWLIFFPNAPYIITDFIHLEPRSSIPLWFDTLLLLSYASTGLLAGWYSLYFMQEVVSRWFDRLTGWVFVMGALFLASFGVYVGRFLRWNSWDVLLDPVGIVTESMFRAASPTAHWRLWTVTGLLLGFFLVSYAFFYTFLSRRGRGGRGTF